MRCCQQLAGYNPRVQHTLLGGLSPSAFLQRYWQKQPLLVRGALPDFCGLLDRRQLFELARREDCESRLVVRTGGWTVEHGPLSARRLRSLPARGWTLLVQGVERLVPAARQLLAQFCFLPHARLDDLMVSFAPPGGGVGPHYDSYDVFLLQGPGRRRWRVGRQADLALVENAPLKILRRFRPQGEAVLEAGDLLYLPPDIAHDGVAETDCFTYSIGFRAPRYDELKREFLAFLEESVHLEGIYQDPELRQARHPSLISEAMIRRVEARLAEIRWNRATVAEFLGRYLTEPKMAVRFDPPAAEGGSGAFGRALAARGARLAPGTLMLMRGKRVYVNGEGFDVPADAGPALLTLADSRSLSARQARSSAALRTLLHRWYRDGYLELD